MTSREVRELGGNGSALDTATRVLAEEGFIRIEESGRAHRHHPIRPFRNDTEEG